MCIFDTPKTPAPEAYKTSAQSRTPDNSGVAGDAARRYTDRARAQTSTILTSANGATDQANTSKKTLLGA